ncbi:hypothetical protein [Kibdelosporangium phytohabitans]|uniref:hypothetical protein n=1 Tax=Kibdelosporangium phytohabitans TaxID=860235 RepID=UPI0012FB3E4B|nr:hypothetical protein [Kibdelosporangium phytohabitans]MBE1461552.1 hypothetical protein [Kibdelosporangium phytohabitans]
MGQPGGAELLTARTDEIDPDGIEAFIAAPQQQPLAALGDLAARLRDMGAPA